MRHSLRIFPVEWSFLFFLFVATQAAAPSAPALLVKIQGSLGEFGSSVVNAGDVNGDGFEDILVGGALEHGGAALYLGGPAADATADLIIAPPPDLTVSTFGSFVSGGGDVNGDGYSDFAISAPYALPEFGAVYIYFGGRALDGDPDLVLHEPTSTTTQFGPSVSLDSDINGDGFADIILGSPGWWDNQEPCGGELPLPCGESPYGRTYVYFGGPDLGNTPDLVLAQPKPWRGDGVWSHAFGVTVASVGDVNGDRIRDYAVAEPSTSGNHGRAVLFFGGANPDSVPDQFLQMVPFTVFQSVSTAGDFNADGFDDIVVSAPFIHDGGGYSLGRAYVYLGSPTLEPDYPDPDLVLGSDQARIGFVHGGRDLDGDGIPDIMAGMPGRTFVYLGAAHPDVDPDAVLECGSQIDYMVLPLAAADWNGDGVADPIVGSAHDRSLGPGAVYIFDISTPLSSRAFARGGRRTIPLARSEPLALQFQPVGASYENSAVDLTSLRLTSTGTGSVSEITPIPDKTMVEQDSNHDGITELTATFRTDDLRQLFGSLHGRQEVEAAIEGRLLDRRRFQAPATLTIVGVGGLEERPARLAPNPLNPQGTLEFTITAPGPVSLRLYDVAGRCVRTVLRNEPYEGGTHQIPVAARDDRGAVLASGVYFYRLELPSGVERGRFVVAK